MRLISTILALLLCSAWHCPSARGQGNVSRTYTGTNGPEGRAPFRPTGPGSTGDHFIANIYGDAIEVLSQGGDQCGRPFYFTGTIAIQPNQTKGTIGGPMLRCTNEELKAACAKVGIRLTDYYEVGYTGTVERNPDQGAYLIKITYPYTIWVKDDCKEKRDTQGTDTILLVYQPPREDPSWGEALHRGERRMVDGIVDQLEGGKLFQHY
ncbi:MAG TPA: hypothetical protein VFV87_10535 [Pirellulaceae bacterium]|nr:hypothetical protein [Pirellulaceae bacterium]